MSAHLNEEFEALYTAHVGMVRQLCLGFCQGREDIAADLCQDIFVNIWRKLDQFRGEASAKTWIYRITVNTCLQYQRSPAQRADASEELPEQLSDFTKSSPDARREALYRAIGYLPEIDRLIYMLTLEGQSSEQIAACTGLSTGGLRVRLHRSRNKLRQILKL